MCDVYPIQLHSQAIVLLVNAFDGMSLSFYNEVDGEMRGSSVGYCDRRIAQVRYNVAAICDIVNESILCDEDNNVA